MVPVPVQSESFGNCCTVLSDGASVVSPPYEAIMGSLFGQLAGEDWEGRTPSNVKVHEDPGADEHAKVAPPPAVSSSKLTVPPPTLPLESDTVAVAL